MGSFTSVIMMRRPSAGSDDKPRTTVAGALGIAEEIRDPERDQRNDHREQP